MEKQLPCITASRTSGVSADTIQAKSSTYERCGGNECCMVGSPGKLASGQLGVTGTRRGLVATSNVCNNSM
eukprot:3874124-Prorocentrum_lima.AAC.1